MTHPSYVDRDTAQRVLDDLGLGRAHDTSGHALYGRREWLAEMLVEYAQKHERAWWAAASEIILLAEKQTREATGPNRAAFKTIAQTLRRLME